jgi:nitroreductase
MDEQLLRDIVAQAARAPSIHNTQPWRFVARGDVLELWSDPTRNLAVIDPTGRARYLSCGAALLHARVAAAAAGHSAEVTVLPDAREPDRVADLRLAAPVEPSMPDRELAAAIPVRRTHRGRFAAGPVGPDVLRDLQSAAATEGCWLRTVSPDETAAVAVVLARADDLQWHDPAYRAELRRWTGRGADAADGVRSTATPDVAPVERGSDFRLRDFAADREEPAGHRPTHGEPPPVERPLVVVLGTDADDVRAWVAAGQGLARVLLRATVSGLAASPMTQALEVPRARERLAAELGLVGHPQMVLRLGPAAEDPEVGATSRRPVEEILTEEVPPN